MDDNYLRELGELVMKGYRSYCDQNVFTVALAASMHQEKDLSNLLQGELEKQNLKVANINIDPWQNPITRRLQKENPAGNFYKKVFRWEDFFTQLITPLKEDGGIYLATMLIRTDADEYYPYTYNFSDVNILLVEGIFLFKKEFLNYYDSKIWIDCSFKTGLQRAIRRNSENLSEGQLVHDYDSYYYPAQRYHFQQDDPQKTSDIIYCNDELLETVGQLTLQPSGEV